MSHQLHNEAGRSGQQPAALQVRLDVEYAERLSRLLLFVKWLLVIPLYIALIFYGVAAGLVTFFAFWAILFTGRLPEGMFDFIRGFLAFSYKTMAYSPLLLTDVWDPSGRASVRVGREQISLPVKHPVDFQVDDPDRLSRLVLVFFKLPSYLLGVAGGLIAVGIFLLVIVAIPAWFIILLAGRYPKPLFRFTLNLLQWVARVNVWQSLLRDDFSLFGTTRAVQVPVALGAVAFVVYGLSLWLPVSVENKILGRPQDFGNLAPQTENILKNLKEPVEAKAFFLPSSNANEEAWQCHVESLLYKFKTSWGKFSYEFIDPNAESLTAEKYGVTSFPTIIFEARESGRRHEVSPSISLEAQFDTALLIVTGHEQTRVDIRAKPNVCQD